MVNSPLFAKGLLLWWLLNTLRISPHSSPWFSWSGNRWWSACTCKTPQPTWIPLRTEMFSRKQLPRRRGGTLVAFSAESWGAHKFRLHSRPWLLTIPITSSRFLLERISQFHTVTVRCWYCQSLNFSAMQISKCFVLRDVDMWSVGEPLKWADNDTWSVVSARDRGRGQCTHLASIGERGEWCQGERTGMRARWAETR